MEIDTSSFQYLNKNYQDSLIRQHPDFNEKGEEVDTASSWLRRQALPLSREDIKCKDSSGSLGLSEWIAHFDIKEENASQVSTPCYYDRDNVTNYFPRQEEDWQEESSQTQKEWLKHMN